MRKCQFADSFRRCGENSYETDTEVPFCPKHRKVFDEWKDAYQKALEGTTGESSAEAISKAIASGLDDVSKGILKIN